MAGTDVSDEQLVERLPHVRIDHDTKHFYRGWLDQRLLLNRCADCGHWHHPPKPVCPRCWSSALVPTPVGGRGTIHLLMRLHQGPPAQGVGYSGGHPVVTVEFEEQQALRFTSTIIGCLADEIAIGMPVELAWTERYGAPFPVFEPLGR